MLLAIRYKFVHSLLVVLPLFVSFSSPYAQGLPAGWESYSDRPDILSLAPQASNGISGTWPNLRQAHLEAVAQILEMYPEFHIYFLARDAELLYDFARLATQNTQTDFERIHLLNVSRANMRDPNTKSYLEQNGISDDLLNAGKKVLFVDTGFAGTIPKVLIQYFPESLRKNIRTHLMASDNTNHPSTRAFLYHINSGVAELNPSSLHGTIVSYEHLPRYTDRSSQFELIGGRWLALSPIGHQSDGTVDKKIATQYQSDLKAFWEDPATQETFNSRRALYRHFNAQDQQARLQSALTQLSSAQDAQIDVIMLDLDDTLLKEVATQFKDHPSVQSINYQPSDSVLQRYKDRLHNPSPIPGKVIHYEIEGSQITSYVSLRPYLTEFLLQLMLKIESKKLRLIITSANDPLRTQAIFSQLRLGDYTLEEMGAELAPHNFFLDQGGNKSFATLRQSLNLKPTDSILAIDDLPEKLIGAADNDYIFKVTPWGPDAVVNELTSPSGNDAIQFGLQDQKDIAELKVLLQKSSISYKLPIGLRKAIAQDIADIKTRQYGAPHLEVVGLKSSQNNAGEKSNKAKLIEKYPQWTHIFENPDDEIPKLFKEKQWHVIGGLIDAELDDEMTNIIIKYLYDAPATGEKKGLQKAFIEKGDQVVLMRLAEYTFSQPHTKGMSDLLRLVIEKGDQEVLRSLVTNTFSQPHTKDMSDLLRLVIEKGDQWVLRSLVTNTFSEPHTKGMSDLLRLVIEKGDQEVLRSLARYTFSQPHTKDMSDLLRLVIEKGDQGVLWSLAEYTFSQPHTKDMSDLLRLVIEKGDQEVLRSLAGHTFSQPHTKDMSDLLRLVIEKGDQVVLSILPTYTFSQPHADSLEYRRLKNLLEEKQKQSCEKLLAS